MPSAFTEPAGQTGCASPPPCANAPLADTASATPAMTRCFFMQYCLLVENDFPGASAHLAHLPGSHAARGRRVDDRRHIRRVGDHHHADAHVEGSVHLVAIYTASALDL